ncbi:MAG: nucleotide exchange factor GrpE, partial [Bacillus sp. (in: firmicutes)]
MTQEQNVKNEEVVEEKQQGEEIVEEIFAEANPEAGQETAEDAQPSDELAEATAKIADLEAKIEASENRYLRLQADFDNFRRRSRLDAEASEKYIAQSLVT